MLDSEIPSLSSQFPSGFARDFDAHVYYDENSRFLAERIREEAERHFKELPVFVGTLRDEKVGPHPKSMFEICFPVRLLENLLFWLENHRSELTVLIHRVTGNDTYDHTEGACWLGAPLLLDESKFTH
jgi:aromatic ring-cleaving dioxygenase